MKVVRLGISNFRGIKSAELLFDGHTLMVGSNNVGKSTICDALDLVLGPDRLNRFPPIDEFDFYNAQYLASPAQEGAEPEEIPLRVEVILIELSAEIDAKCGGNTEFWHLEEQRLWARGSTGRQPATCGSLPSSGDHWQVRSCRGRIRSQNFLFPQSRRTRRHTDARL